MLKLKKVLASLTSSSKSKADAAKVQEETPESRYELARDTFLAYNAQLEGTHALCGVISGSSPVHLTLYHVRCMFLMIMCVLNV